jgi:hypothetical protein
MPIRTPPPHRAYALRHLNKAVERLIVSTTPTEKAEAGRWARLWARAAGKPFDRPRRDDQLGNSGLAVTQRTKRAKSGFR